jgi:AhpD family alkylhydroperoxidase
MNAIANETETKEFDQLKTRLKATWMTGDYDVFSRYMEKDAEQFFLRLGVKPGARLLDVGCGTGQLALIAARAGAQVTGCDIATNWVEKAQARAAAEGLQIAFEEGDAEALPYKDAQFDVVVSLIGAMFAPRPDRVATELTRVCRPDGLIAMANWTPGGFIGQMFKTISKHIAPSGMPSPVLWGDEATVRERLRDGIADLKFARLMYRFDYPFSPEAVVDFFRANYGPMSRAFASLDVNGQENLRTELVNLWSAHNKAVDGATKVDAEYLEVIATRSSNVKEPKMMHPMDNLSKLPKMGKLAPEAATAFWAFDKAALADGAIPKKYKELMAIAVALTTQCAYCLEVHRQQALKAGVTEQELAEAVHVTAALRAGAAVTHGTHLFEA